MKNIEGIGYIGTLTLRCHEALAATLRTFPATELQVPTASLPQGAWRNTNSIRSAVPGQSLTGWRGEIPTRIAELEPKLPHAYSGAWGSTNEGGAPTCSLLSNRWGTPQD